MRIFWTVFWAFLLSEMLVYVIGAMSGSAFSFMQGVILAVVFSIVVLVVGEAGVPNEPHDAHH